MARTKNQARAGREESARRSTAVNEREGSRVGTTTAGEADGDEARSASGSERARRAAIRGRRDDRVTATASNKDERVDPSTNAINSGRDMQAAAEGTQVDRERAASGSGSVMMAEGVESENYYTALAGDKTGEVNGDPTATGAEESTGGQTEAPSIKSPHKTRAGGTSNNRHRTAEGTRKVIRKTMRKGSRVLGFVTPEPTATTTEKTRRTAEKRGGAMDGTEDTGAPSSARTGQTARMSKRKVGGFFQRLKPVMEGLLGQLETALVTGMEEVPGERNEKECDNVACPAIVQLVVNKHELFVRALLGKGISSWDQTKLAFIRLQWLMDRGKTKAEAEERSVQYCAIRVFKNLQHMTDKAGPKEEWTARGIEFGEAMGELLRILEGVKTGVEADDFPRAMYQASIEKKGQRETRRHEVRQEEASEQMRRGHGNPQGGNGHGEDVEGQRHA